MHNVIGTFENFWRAAKEPEGDGGQGQTLRRPHFFVSRAPAANAFWRRYGSPNAHRGRGSMHLSVVYVQRKCLCFDHSND